MDNLHRFIDAQMLKDSYMHFNKKSAGGTDRKTYQEYGQDFPQRCESLLSEFKSGRYRPPAIRWVCIDKDKQKRRSSGIPTTEDKVLQASVYRVL